MLSDKMQKALNDQINHELYSSYLYLQLSAWCSLQGLNGFAHWLRVQADEETDHANRIYNYINHHQGRIVLQTIKQPPSDFPNVTAVMEAALGHEQKMTKLIHDLNTLAETEKDPATRIFLQWFVTEQIEEEAVVSQILHDLGLAGDSGPGLFMLDRELAARGPEKEEDDKE